MEEKGYIEDRLESALEDLKEKNKEVPCRENSIAITKIEEALMWLDARARDRQARGVAGTKEE